MITIYLGATGLLAFILGTGILGIWIRNQPSQVNAEKFSRIMHFLFFAGLAACRRTNIWEDLRRFVGLKRRYEVVKMAEKGEFCRF